MTTSMELDQELNDMAERELRADAGAPGDARNDARRDAPREALRPEVLPVRRGQDRNIATATHLATVAAAVFSGGLLSLVVPAVAYAAFHDKDEFVKGHIRGQLNFQITRLLVTVACVVAAMVTFGVGAVVAVPVILFFFIADLVFSVRAAMASSRAEDYAFPLSMQLVR